VVHDAAKLKPADHSQTKQIIGAAYTMQQGRGGIKDKKSGGKNGSGGAKDTKAWRDAEKLVNKQTDKTEVNKYLLCLVDPELGQCSNASPVSRVVDPDPDRIRIQ
jgi:hypothetical protein